MKDYDFNILSVNDIVSSLNALESSVEEDTFEHMLSFASELTGMSVDRDKALHTCDFSRELNANLNGIMLK